MLRKSCFGMLLATALLLSIHMKAQPLAVYKYSGDTVLTIRSTVLNEDRKIYLYHPDPDSSDVNKRFPVLYVMDADNHFQILVQYIKYLSRADVMAMPKAIVVGIGNTDRRRDLTPTESIVDYEGIPDSSNLLKKSGGNKNFLQFISTELIPAIDAKYQTNAYRVFAGHSFGGLASLNCLLTYPDLFDAYIAVSPSLWWDHEYLLKFAGDKLRKGSPLHKKIFYSNGDEGGPNSFFHKGLMRLDSLIKGKRLVGLIHLYKYYPYETHMTEPVIAYYEALRFIFKEFAEQHHKR